MAPNGIPSGDQILAQQGKPKGFQFGPTAGGIYGGGTSPVKTSDTIHVGDFGKLAVWAGDGYLEVATADYVTDAPDDGQPYIRESGDWVLLSTATGAVAEAPNDGRTYTRTGSGGFWQALPYLIPEAPGTGQGYVRNGLNASWQIAFSQAAADARYAPIATESFPEAPTDGIAYARRGWDRTWQPVATGTGVPEAPPFVGNTYTRDGAHQTWVVAFNQTLASQLFAPISLVQSAVLEAPPDGLPYVRNGALRTWEPAFTLVGALSLFAPITTVSFPEAPFDGRLYARRGADNSWQVIPVVKNWITDAPADGNLYVRDGTIEAWVNVQTLDLDGGQYP